MSIIIDLIILVVISKELFNQMNKAVDKIYLYLKDEEERKMEYE